MGVEAPPARYFPIDSSPYRMRAGLMPFGTDFGNGVVDRQFFQRDRQAPRYREAKRAVRPERSGVRADTDASERTHRAVLDWIRATWRTEHPEAPLPDTADSWQDDYAGIAASIQEDFAVLCRDADGRERAIAVFVDLPSGWRPERILNATFAEIHDPVPEFADDPAQARSMASSMIDRGPYVRFVWTLSADDALDHHPEEGGRRTWRGARRAWLRVERQVTVPFRAEAASLFLIRTYLYPLDELAVRERADLRNAVASMPADVARYKALEGEPRDVALRLLMN